jgi:hypothetical protein
MNHKMEILVRILTRSPAVMVDDPINWKVAREVFFLQTEARKQNEDINVAPFSLIITRDSLRCDVARKS